MPRRAERVNGQHSPDRSRVPAEVNLPRLRARKERAARAHLDTAHLAGADGGAGGGGAERQWGADEGGDPGRDLPLGARGRRRACEVPGGDPGGVRGAGAAGAGPVHGRWGDSAGSDAARVGGGGDGHQSRGVVHPALRTPLSELAGRGGTAVAVVRAARSGLGRAVPRKSGGQSMPGRESVSVKRPCRFAGTQCGGRPARAPRSARESPESSSEPARDWRKKPSPWGTKCLYPHSHPGISKTCGQRARLPEGASPEGDPHRPSRGAGGPFRREGALMAHLHCSGSIAGG